MVAAAATTTITKVRKSREEKKVGKVRLNMSSVLIVAAAVAIPKVSKSKENWNEAIKPYSLQIVQRIDHGYYALCIVKTVWLKILQRKWKRYYHSMLAKRKNPRNLMYRQITGKWKN